MEYRLKGTKEQVLTVNKNLITSRLIHFSILAYSQLLIVTLISQYIFQAILSSIKPANFMFLLYKLKVTFNCG